MRHLSLELLSLEGKEALVNGAERLFEVSVLLEPLVSNDAGAIRQMLICLEAAHEEEVRLLVFSRRRGRPALEIRQDQLAFLVASNFRVTDIAGLFGCSTRTIQRRMRDLA